MTKTKQLPKDMLIDMLGKMQQIRAFEQKAEEMFALGKVHGTMHLSIGQEASAVGAVAALRKAQLVLKNGSFNLKRNLPNLRRNKEGMLEFVLVPGKETQTATDITLTQKDIRAVQLAKGAILTGILLLCQEVMIDLPQRFLIAGAFGSFLDKDDAKVIGMLPRVAEDAVKTIGNAAGEGAILVLLNRDFSQRAREIARRTRVLDLASHPDFQEVFVKSLSFPDVDESGRD